MITRGDLRRRKIVCQLLSITVSVYLRGGIILSLSFKICLMFSCISAFTV